MDILELGVKFANKASLFIPFLLTLISVIVGLILSNKFLRWKWRNKPNARFQFQLTILGLTLFSGLLLIISAPISETLRGELLGLIGILLSAAIALSSTTFIGNIMAGIMLRVIQSIRPGDFILVAEITGRVTEMGLLHTEIQTEDRDLVTVPNIYMVTQPMKVVRATGTIISAEVSLGYDVSHTQISDLLKSGAKQAGLQDVFVQIRELGDFSVLYRVGGLLQEVNNLISAKSKLRGFILDSLHRSGIEIVSPNFMNTKSLAEDKVMIPKPTRQKIKRPEVTQEQVAFDKADHAASIEETRSAIKEIEAEQTRLNEEQETGFEEKKEILERKKLRLIETLKQAKEELKSG